GPFMKAPEAAKKKLVKVQMKLENKRWTLDFDAIRAAITPRTRMFMLCNPYNPAGTVFTKQELQTLSDICSEHNIIICSDEIHCDLILDETKNHVSIATLGKEAENQTITLLSPSKTFNIAGLGCSIMPLIGIKNELLHGDLQIIPVKDFPITSVWNLVWMKNKNFSPVAAAFLKYIKEQKETIIHEKFEWFEKF
ncbi:MAG: aminotransferase class I/II-fold pyridoxal phosphate-dependent enzyme, partial [Emticicia sp.]